MSDFKYIPSIDLADFKSEDPKKKKAFIKEIGLAYEKIGFVAVKNHGLNENLCAQLYKEVEDFFQMEKEQKKNNMKLSASQAKEGMYLLVRNTLKTEMKEILKNFGILGKLLRIMTRLKSLIQKI
jgi:isopenicillin N synthase-like dioxygenase